MSLPLIDGVLEVQVAKPEETSAGAEIHRHATRILEK